jgi:CBS domain-containing protein
MKRNEPVSNIMTADVTTVHVGQKLSDVRKLFAEGKFHHVPVVDGQRLVGVISTTDLIKLTFEAFGQDARAIDAILDHQFSIAQAMQTNLTVVGVKDTVRQAAELLSGGQFHSLPVVDVEGNLQGIVTSTDLIRYLLDQY